MRVVFDQKQSRWRWVAGLLLAVLCVGGLMDYAVRHLLWRAALQPAVQAAYAFSVAWDDFWEMAARQVTFQRTLSVCVDLLDPRKRLSLWRSVANWADEMRRCADADAWVLTDSKGAIVAKTPNTVVLSSWRPVWRQPFLSLPCTFAVVSSGETLLAGVGAPVLENGRPRGELWLLYRLHRVAGKMPALSGFRWRLVAGKHVLAAGGNAEGERNAPFVFPLKAVPVRLKVWVPTALLPMGWVQVLIWASLFLLLVLAAILAEHAKKRTPERMSLVALEVCHALSEQLLRSRDASKVFQALADAVTTWLNLPGAVVLKLDMENKVARVLGFAPRNLVTQLALRYFGIDPTQFTVPFTADIPAFKAALQGAPYISANPSDFLGDLFPPDKVALVQRLLKVKLGWGALLFAEGKPIGALLTATPRNAFSDEELKALELIRQHAAVLLALAEQWVALEQFQELVENAPVGIFRSTPDGRFLMANETLAKIHGYESVAELMALDIPSQIYLNPEDRERFKRFMEVHGSVANFRFPIKRKDGSIAWVAEWARSVKDETGKVRSYEGFVLDVTDQVQLVERLRSLQETSRTLVMRLDLDSILKVAVTEFPKLSPDAAVLVFRSDDVTVTLEAASENAHDLLSVLHTEHPQPLKLNAFAPLHERLLAGEHIVTNDLSTGLGAVFRELTKLGYQSLYLRGIGDESHLWGVIAVFRKGASFSEMDLTFLNSFCDFLSIAVKNTLLFVQVQKAYDELRTMSEQVVEQERLRALGQIASGIAHDINNALVPIQGFAEILLEHNDPVVRQAAETIFKSATDIATTVQRMREFYRPHSGDEVKEPVDLNALCKDALEMSRPRWFNMAQERGIVIETRLKLSDDLPPLSGVPSEIRQAIINLILNAVDAMPEGGILTIRTHRQERGGRAWAVVEVSDTGVGMDAETRRRAFEPFFTTKPHGSGLGLAAVYRTVQRHEGFVEIDSEVGEGTTVRLWFPSNLVLPQALPEGEVPSLRVLVIDDEPSVREVLALLLYRDGHLVTTATNGEEGVMLFQNAQWQGKAFDVVITDLGMPKVDGLRVARQVKSLSPETPVILLTGWGFRIRSEDVQRIVDVVLTKPVTHQQLRRALSQVWSKRLEKAN